MKTPKDLLAEFYDKLNEVGKINNPITQMEQYLSLSNFFKDIQEQAHKQGYQKGYQDALSNQKNSLLITKKN